MSPTQNQPSRSPRRRRLQQNRNVEAGMRNRQNGLFKKTDTWYRYYGGDALIFIKRPDGRITGYESRPGLLPEFSKLSIPAHDILGPDEIPKKAGTPSTTAQGDESSAATSSRSSTPNSFSSNGSSESSNSSLYQSVSPDLNGSLPAQSSPPLSVPSPLFSPSPSPSPSPSSSPSPSPSPSRKKIQRGSPKKSKPIPMALRLAVMSFDTCFGRN
ncbi:uncharacterized protein FTOL_06878 [Fusarium torulosum]|uniref:MADS-box domain-containing protein n=1 Tax=Fusarium torulosum TaxID=33205 RepID=A0AAE8SII1_9HYPO|nr:uncharacterized protein FTOL_06878 [Fusarium torulosum]